MYRYLDRQLRIVVLKVQRAFRQYSAPFDELNVFADVRDLYQRLDYINRELFRDIAEHYYRRELADDEVTIEDLWINQVLAVPSKVINYAYATEVMRKRDRLIEALISADLRQEVMRKRDRLIEGPISAGGRQEILDRAMRQWVQMTGWFAVEIADAAGARAREERGITRVRWCSEHDDRVCPVCHRRNGNVYTIETVPVKPHPNCRCWLEDVV